MTDTKKTLQELNDIIDFLKDKVDEKTGFAGTEKADWEKRINEVRNNSEAEELSVKGIENLGNFFATEKAKLETEKKKAEEDKETAEQALADLKKEVGDKLTASLIEALEQNPAKFEEIKALCEELKTKGVNYVVDLSPVNSKLESLASKKNHDWIGIGTLIVATGSFLLLLSSFIYQKGKNQKTVYHDDDED